MPELNEQNLNKVVSKLVVKVLKYRILFIDQPTILDLDYRYDSLITLYLVLIGISIQMR